MIDFIGLVLLGIGLFILVGVFATKRRWVGCIFCFLAGLFLFFLAWIHHYSPINDPPELKADGQYEVQPADNCVDKEGKKWVGVLILTEGGKTIEGLKPYRKIPHSKFGFNNVVIGIPMTIILKTHESYQELIVKKDY